MIRKWYSLVEVFSNKIKFGLKPIKPKYHKLYLCFIWVGHSINLEIYLGHI